jgi:hypothetical protein
MKANNFTELYEYSENKRTAGIKDLDIKVVFM